VKSAEQERLF
jgi:hypothetical protein